MSDKIEMHSLDLVESCAKKIAIKPDQIRLVCAWCKLVMRMELEQPVEISHGICPECYKKTFQDIFKDKK